LPDEVILAQARKIEGFETWLKGITLTGRALEEHVFRYENSKRPTASLIPLLLDGIHQLVGFADKDMPSAQNALVSERLEWGDLYGMANRIQQISPDGNDVQKLKENLLPGPETPLAAYSKRSLYHDQQIKDNIDLLHDLIVPERIHPADFF